MAVYSTMIRDDPDSRARLRVTPEQILNLPVHHCLASWIAGGTRAASFIGQTFPFPHRHRRRLGAHPPARLHDAVGPYPETLASTLTLHGPPSAEPRRQRSPTHRPVQRRRTDRHAKRRHRGAATRRTHDRASRRPPRRPARRAGRDAEPAVARRRAAVDGAAARAARRADRSEPKPQFASPVLRVVGRPARALDDDHRPSRPRTACASSPSSTASTRSSRSSTSHPPSAAPASTTPTTRSSPCSTAPACSCPR